jgi:hypothetical protein
VLKATLTQSTGLTSGRRWRLRPRWALTLRCGHTGTRDAAYAETGTKRGLKLSSTVEIADPPKRVRCRTCEREEQS